MAKKITFDTEARDALKKGVDALANAVKIVIASLFNFIFFIFFYLIYY